MSDPTGNPAGFGDLLAGAVRARATPAIVGLDPRFDSLPEGLQSGADHGLGGRSGAVAQFCRGVIDVVAPLVAAVKPQLAFFERLGPPGLAVLAEVIEYAHRAGLLVILDGKRNDIGSTASAYADAYLGAGGQSPWGGDALTVSPYLGADSLEPFLAAARARQAGVFVLVKTSNPGGGLLQDALVDGRPLYLRVAALVEQAAEASAGAAGYGAVGAVVGATYAEQLAELRRAMPHAWLLVPGYGTQGGTAADVAGAFDERGLGAIINNARGIIYAHSQPAYHQRFAPGNWQAAVEAATRDMIDSLAAQTPAGRLQRAQPHPAR